MLHELPSNFFLLLDRMFSIPNHLLDQFKRGLSLFVYTIPSLDCIYS